MGGKQTSYEGITARGDSVRIRWSEHGKLQSGTLDIPPTPANLKYASNVRAEILDKIRYGIFTYGDYFPNSKRARAELVRKERDELKLKTFGEVAELWYATATGELTTGTAIKYRQALDRYWLPWLGLTPIADINYMTLILLINGYKENDKKTHKTSIKWTSAKHKNNSLIPLRQVFAFAYMGDIIPTDPTTKLKNAKLQRPDPDPLTPEEAELIIGHMRERYGHQVANYFQFAIYTGMRPSELIALKWQDIDFRHKTARVQRAWTFNEEKETKTYSSRDVKLNAWAWSALIGQKPYTFMQNEHIFHNPNTDRAWNSEQAQRRSYWIPTLKALGIRHRESYQTRHTYATMNLMAGANPMWVAKQMGHSSMQMLLTVYSKWIDQAEKNREVDKLEQFLRQSIANKSSATG